MCSHVEAVPETVKEMQEAGPIHDIPVLVLTPGKSTPLSIEHLDGIGDNVQQVIAEASAHWIHLDEPALVIDSIREMVTAAIAEPVAASG
jgi:pimeloyl-ACP methyl ester carboxylesterase